METFDERLEYGKALEYVAIARFLENDIHAEEIDSPTGTHNMISGDIVVYQPNSKLPIRIDAKRTPKVSKTSVENFTGAYYLFSPNGSLNQDKWWLVKSSLIKSYCSKIDKPYRFKDGTEYYEIPVDNIRQKISFRDFINNGCI